MDYNGFSKEGQIPKKGGHIAEYRPYRYPSTVIRPANGVRSQEPIFCCAIYGLASLSEQQRAQDEYRRIPADRDHEIPAYSPLPIAQEQVANGYNAGP
jgi:hypothetical protein